MSEDLSHHPNKISFPQLVNLSLAAFLLLGIAFTTYTLTSASNTDADAARGGGGSGGGGKKPTVKCSTCVVTMVSPNPVPVGTAPTFNITGYAPGATIITQMTGYIKQDWLTADSNGATTYTFYETLKVPGTYTFYIGTYGGGWVSSITFTVQ